MRAGQVRAHPARPRHRPALSPTTERSQSYDHRTPADPVLPAEPPAQPSRATARRGAACRPSSGWRSSSRSPLLPPLAHDGPPAAVPEDQELSARPCPPRIRVSNRGLQRVRPVGRTLDLRSGARRPVPRSRHSCLPIRPDTPVLRGVRQPPDLSVAAVAGVAAFPQKCDHPDLEAAVSRTISRRQRATRGAPRRAAEPGCHNLKFC